MAHEHIQAFFAYELEKKLEEIQRRGIGFINCVTKNRIEYCIDDTVYVFMLEERGREDSAGLN